VAADTQAPHSVLTPEDRRISWRSLPFFAVHVAAVAMLVWQGWSWSGFALAFALYYIRIFGVTGGYHRYFSHKTYKTSRWFQFVLALLATSSSQKGVIWWAAHHRLHHRKSDLTGDVHSAKIDGFWWSHVGWILSDKFEKTDEHQVKDLLKYPELRWLDRWFLVPPIALGFGCWLAGGWWALTWFFVSTVLCWHGTFTINSLTHMIGNRRYNTTDNSKNHWLLALITMGEGWHNNHHFYMKSTRQGFFWWEIDMTYYVLRALQAVGLVWDIQEVPEHVKQGSLKPIAKPVEPAPAPIPVAELEPAE
jgi:stearoyl-CoA desaturase (delta-9 desaturase)